MTADDGHLVPLVQRKLQNTSPNMTAASNIAIIQRLTLQLPPGIVNHTLTAYY